MRKLVSLRFGPSKIHSQTLALICGQVAMAACTNSCAPEKGDQRGWGLGDPLPTHKDLYMTQKVNCLNIFQASFFSTTAPNSHTSPSRHSGFRFWSQGWQLLPRSPAFDHQSISHEIFLCRSKSMFLNMYHISPGPADDDGSVAGLSRLSPRKNSYNLLLTVIDI